MRCTIAIVVRHQPQAGAIGQAGLAGGYADYQKLLAELALRQQQMQQQQSLALRGQNLDRLNAITQAAVQTGNRQQDRQFEFARAQQDHANRLQAMPIAAALETQQYQQRGQIEQGLLDRRLAAQQAMQEAKTQEQTRMQEVADRWKNFANPFADYGKQQQQWQSQGMQFTPEQNSELKEIHGKMRRVKAEYGAGRLTRPDALAAFQPLYERMWTIEPAGRTPDLRKDLMAKIVTDLPGMEGMPLTLNKDGEPEIIRNWKPETGAPGSPGTGGKGAVADAKIGGEMAKMHAKQTADRQKFIMDQLDKWRQSQMAMGVMPDPNAEAMMQQQLEQRSMMAYPEIVAMNPESRKHEWVLPGGGRPLPDPGAASSEATSTAAPAMDASGGGGMLPAPPTGPPAPATPPPETAIQSLETLKVQFAADPAKRAAASNLQAILSVYGTDITKWPPEVAQAAAQERAILKGA